MNTPFPFPPPPPPRMLPVEANSNVNGSVAGKINSNVPPRPFWALVPLKLCLYLEDMVTLACAAATASTDDSELLDLQEAGVMMLTEVARMFGQVRATSRWWIG